MGLDAYFLYDASSKRAFEVDEFAGRGVLSFLQYVPADDDAEDVPLSRNPVLFPSFVDHLTKPEEVEDAEPWTMSDEQYELFLEGNTVYRGPSFDPQELRAWATEWVRLLTTDEQGLRVFVPLTDAGFDWAPAILEEFQEIISQSDCAMRHGSTIHIEIY